MDQKLKLIPLFLMFISASVCASCDDDEEIITGAVNAVFSASKSSSQLIDGQRSQIVIFEQEEQDPGSAYSPETGRYVTRIPFSGSFRCTLNVAASDPWGKYENISGVEITIVSSSKGVIASQTITENPEPFQAIINLETQDLTFGVDESIFIEVSNNNDNSMFVASGTFESIPL